MTELDRVGDITHGGLSLQETPQWVETKKVIEAESGCKVVQWHRDELSDEVRVTQNVEETTFADHSAAQEVRIQ